jgi:hypothetical protein
VVITQSERIRLAQAVLAQALDDSTEENQRKFAAVIGHLEPD